jgi:hypothetical protein
MGMRVHGGLRNEAGVDQTSILEFVDDLNVILEREGEAAEAAAGPNVGVVDIAGAMNDDFTAAHIGVGC